MTTCVQVKLELGHRATVRDQATDDGFTHDWTVFVRGQDACNIHHFVEKVIFNLHRDFAKPKRVIKEPPFEVSESGYGSFLIPIDVYFKQKEEPKKVQFNYDLYLNIQSPVNHIRCEKLTFQNPTEEFRRKLMRAGGVGIVENSGVTLNPHHYQRPSTPNLVTGTLSSQSKERKVTSVAIKAPKSSSSSSSGGSNSSQLKETTPNDKNFKTEAAKSLPPPASKSFVDLFGQPISKTSKPSPEPQKLKNSQSKKSGVPSHQVKSSAPVKEVKNSIGVLKDTNKGQLKEKTPTSKRRSSSPDSPRQNANKKRKRGSTSPSSSHGSYKSKESGGSCKEVDNNKVTEKKNNLVKVKSEKKEKSSKIKSSNCSSSRSGESVKQEGGGGKTGKEAVSKPVKKLRQERALTSSSSSPSLSTNSSLGSNGEVNNSSSSRSNREISQFTPSEHRPNYEADAYVGGGEESRSSTSSFSSVHQYKGSGPLGALMAELDYEQDEQDGVLSPLSSDGYTPNASPRSGSGTSQHQESFPPPLPPPPPPPLLLSPPLSSPTPPVHGSSEINKPSKPNHDHYKVGAGGAKSKGKEDKVKETSKTKKSGSNHEHASTNDVKKGGKKMAADKLEAVDYQPLVKSPRPVQFEISKEYILELQDLQKRIMLLKDRQHLQKIVNVIEETGQFQVTSTTFDFDLCRLDKGTVKKLQSCLSVI